MPSIQKSKPSLDRDLEGRVGVEQVLQPRPRPGQSGGLDGGSGLGLEGPHQGGRDVAAGVAGAASHLQADVHLAVGADQGRPRQRAARSRA